MNDRLQIYIVEPSAKEKSRQLAGALMGSRAVGSDLDVIKSRLRQIREGCLREYQALLQEFKNNVEKCQGVKVKSAYDTEEAVDYIKAIAGATKTIIVNRSSVVMNELKPGLGKRGFRVSEPYYAESDLFENRIRDYWDLPNLLEKGLIGNFAVSAPSTSLSLPLAHERTVKDCVAVLGVNAVSAEDGSVFFLQHFSNISRSLEQAREVVLVVGLEKLTKSKEDAVFQTNCMGIFGMESMLLSLRSKRAEFNDMGNLPDSREPGSRAVHVILLDNGRSQILGSTMKELFLCIGCRACIQQCPINHHMSQDSTIWTPKDYLLTFLLGKNRSLDTCLQCGACYGECPLAIDIPKLMWIAQADHAARHGRTLQEHALGNPELLAKAGSLAAPVSNVIANAEPGKTIIKTALGLDRKRQLPTFHRETLKRWFSKRDAKGREAMARRKVAYFVGCFANYYETEVAKTLVNVLERNGFEVLVPDHKCCGMPMMAAKNMKGARQNAEFNIRSLAAVAARGYDIVTTCPSCSLMLKEYPSLFSGHDARLVSERSYFVDQYLMLLSRRGDLNRDLGKISTSVFYHVPCHLKAQDMAEDSLELLHLIPGLSIARVSAICCGMAGYHGHKKAHSALSMEIGAKLFEDIRLCQAERIVTSCAACKMQIQAGTGARATHPIVLLEEAYSIGPLAQ